MPLTRPMLRFLTSLTLHSKGTLRRTFVNAGWITGLAIACLVWPSPSRGQANADWVGKRVVQRYSQFQLKIESQVVDVNNWLETYEVEHTTGSWLWLHAGQLKGWATAEEVVPIDQAIEYFTNFIRAYLTHAPPTPDARLLRRGSPHFPSLRQ